MKKLFAMVMAVAAISFASCGNKTDKECCGEDSCASDTCVCQKQCPVKALAEKLEAGDVEGVTAAFAEAQEKLEALVAEGKTEEAQKIGSAIQQFIETNKEKLADAKITVDNIVATIAGLPAAAEATAEAGVDAVKADAKAAADAAVDAANAKVEEVTNAAVDAANQAVEAGKAEANKQIDKGVEAAKKKMGL